MCGNGMIEKPKCYLTPEILTQGFKVNPFNVAAISDVASIMVESAAMLLRTEISYFTQNQFNQM
jgi:hypothetical protein